MKTQQNLEMLKKAALILFAGLSLMACSKNSDKATAPSNLYNQGYYGNAACPNCTGINQNSPVLFQGNAVDPDRQAFQVSAQVLGDQMAIQQIAAQGLRPLVNGTYPVEVRGVFTLGLAVSCGNQVYPPGQYQFRAMGQNKNGIVNVPEMVLAGPVPIQPAAVTIVFVDANLDNVSDARSLFRVGFCGAWLDMNTI